MDGINVCFDPRFGSCICFPYLVSSIWLIVGEIVENFSADKKLGKINGKTVLGFDSRF